jgi:hypothetical protein
MQRVKLAGEVGAGRSHATNEAGESRDRDPVLTTVPLKFARDSRVEQSARVGIVTLLMKIMPLRLAAFALATLLIAGCETRSISNSSYDHAYRARQMTEYRGELSELDVVGLDANAPRSDEAIQAALQDTARPQLAANSRVLLIQSGADLPDEPMVTALTRRVEVLPFSGRPGARPFENHDYARTLRLAAARGGYDKIVCYWGVLESQQHSQITKAISWVPIAGYFVPDSKEQMRIRLKAVIVDVASGRWTFVTPRPSTDADYDSIVTRRETDQGLVARLKAKGYEDLVAALLPGARLIPIPRMKFGVMVDEPLRLDRGVDLRGGNARVAEHFLDRAQVGAAGQKMRGE